MRPGSFPSFCPAREAVGKSRRETTPRLPVRPLDESGHDPLKLLLKYQIGKVDRV